MKSVRRVYILLALAIFLLALWIYMKGGVLEFYKKAICKDTQVVPEDKRILVQAIKSRKAIVPDSYSQNIPKLIIQTNEKDLIPEGMYESTNSILRANPEYDYIYFDNSEARRYISEFYSPEVLNAYDKLIPGAYKADLFRYCILYKLGGVYVDTGMVARGPLRSIIRSDDKFVSPEDDGTAGVYNAFIACVPGHPIIKNAIDMCVLNIRNEDYKSNPLEITGPGLLAEALKSVVGESKNGYRVPQPDEVYNSHLGDIRIIRYIRTGFCTTEGNIYDGDTLLLTTRYPTYHIDRNWYNTHKHYSELWRKRNVFETPEIKSKLSLEKHQAILLDLLTKFKALAEREKLEWWATGGTLLGAVRDGKIIEWDDDIDIEAPPETIEKLQRLNLDAEGLKLTFDDHIWRIKYSDQNVEHSSPHTSIHEPYIDVFEVEKKFSGTRDKIKDTIWGYVDKVCTERWPKSFFYSSELFPLKDIKFGDIKIRAPKNPEFYLERQYGDWRTPVKEKGHYEF